MLLPLLPLLLGAAQAAPSSKPNLLFILADVCTGPASPWRARSSPLSCPRRQLHASAAAGHAADVVCAALTVRPLPLPAQDLGHNDVGWANNRTRTPHLDALVKDGVELLQW